MSSEVKEMNNDYALSKRNTRRKNPDLKVNWSVKVYNEKPTGNGKVPGGGGDYHMEGTGMLVGSFEFNP